MLLLFLLVVFLAYQNNAMFNLTKNQVIIASLIAYYFIFMNKEEKFDLTATGTGISLPGGVSSAQLTGPIVMSKSGLDPNKYYLTADLKNDRRINEIAGPLSGGASCPQFPLNVYREVIRDGICSGPGITGQVPASTINATAINDDANYSAFSGTPVIGSTLRQ